MKKGFAVFKNGEYRGFVATSESGLKGAKVAQKKYFVMSTHMATWRVIGTPEFPEYEYATTIGEYWQFKPARQ